MLETLERLYKTGKINETALDNAVGKGWITQEQKMELLMKQQGSE